MADVNDFMELAELRAAYDDAGRALRCAMSLLSEAGVPVLDGVQRALDRASDAYRDWRAGRCDFCLTPGDEISGPVERKYGPTGRGAAHAGCYGQYEYDRAESHRERVDALDRF